VPCRCPSAADAAADDENVGTVLVLDRRHRRDRVTGESSPDMDGQLLAKML
jgi:hypothetical protein